MRLTFLLQLGSLLFTFFIVYVIVSAVIGIASLVYTVYRNSK